MTTKKSYLQTRNLDLAAEAHSLLQGKANQEVAGVSQRVENYSDCKVTEIEILNQAGADVMSRPIGTYITIDVPTLKEDFTGSLLEPISSVLGKELKKLLPKQIKNDETVLIVGLGNFQITPDALGPQTIAFTQPTRHFYQQTSAKDKSQVVSLCAIAPGVVGNTGIETSEIIKGTVEKVKPSCLIVIDALAAASITRIGTTIQLANTGIQPGSGISNHRHPITAEYMQVPVIAIGMPTVVHAGMVINEAIESCLGSDDVEFSTNNENLILETIDSMLKPFNGDLLVTPKEIDHLIPMAAKIIAAAIVQACHPGANEQNFSLYLQ